jgi:hypothetical protein
MKSKDTLTEEEQIVEDALEIIINTIVTQYNKEKKGIKYVKSKSSVNDTVFHDYAKVDMLKSSHNHMSNDLNSEEIRHQPKKLFIVKLPNREICLLSAQDMQDARSKLEKEAEATGALIYPYNGNVYFDFKPKNWIYRDLSDSKSITCDDIPKQTHQFLDYFLNGGKFSDIELHVKRKKFKAHRIILAQYPYFSSKNLQSPTLSLDSLGFAPNVIKLILIQIYTMESINLPDILSKNRFNILWNLLDAANVFGLLRFKCIIEKSIAEQLDLCKLANNQENSANPFTGFIGIIPKSERIEIYAEIANFALKCNAMMLLSYILSNMKKCCHESELLSAKLDSSIVKMLNEWEDSDNYVWNPALSPKSIFEYDLKNISTDSGKAMWGNIAFNLFPKTFNIASSTNDEEKLKEAILSEEEEDNIAYIKMRDMDIEKNVDVNQFAPILLQFAKKNQMY